MLMPVIPSPGAPKPGSAPTGEASAAGIAVPSPSNAPSPIGDAWGSGGGGGAAARIVGASKGVETSLSPPSICATVSQPQAPPDALRGGGTWEGWRTPWSIFQCFSADCQQNRQHARSANATHSMPAPRRRSSRDDGEDRGASVPGCTTGGTLRRRWCRRGLLRAHPVA
eukprot:2570589-Rhodomonas_salina.1